jgi:hypothetical protein
MPSDHPSLRVEIPYLCDGCGRTDYRYPPPVAAGTADDSARCAGFRISATPANPRNVICPACAGTDPDYWNRQVLAMARQAGI